MLRLCECDCDCGCDMVPVPASSSYPLIRFPMTKYLFPDLNIHPPPDEGVTRRQALSGHR